MKKIIALFFIAGSLASCDNSGSGSQNPVDSIEERTDSLKQNVDSALGDKIDSLEERREELKEKFDSAKEKRIDSVKQKQ